MEPRVSTFHKASILRPAWTTIHELSTFMTHLRAQRLTRHKKKEAISRERAYLGPRPTILIDS
jgi:hypothetical protein